MESIKNHIAITPSDSIQVGGPKLCACGNPAQRNSKYGRCYDCGVKKRYADKLAKIQAKREAVKLNGKPASEAKFCVCGCKRVLKQVAQIRFATGACKARYRRAMAKTETQAYGPIAPKATEARKIAPPSEPGEYRLPSLRDSQYEDCPKRAKAVDEILARVNWR